jgi:hypothetical protein
MTNETIELAPGVRASLVEGAFPAAVVRWVEGYLSIGVTPTHPEYARQVDGTTGSSTDAVDEWRFDRGTGHMVSAYWGMPSIDAAWEDWKHVLDVPVRGRGTLTLVDRRPFVLQQTMIGAFDPAGSALVCMMAGTHARDVEARYEIAPDVFVFSSAGRNCGWALIQPTDKDCLRGEELLPLPVDELRRARVPLAQTLAGIFELYSNDGQAPLAMGEVTLERRLEQLGAGLARRVSPVASRTVMHSIEQWFVNQFIVPEVAAGPWMAAEARNLKSGRTFEADNREARGLRRSELHSFVRERVNIEERIVRLHRDLRWPDPKVVEGEAIDSSVLARWVRERPQLILDWLAAAEIPPEVTGLSTLDQFERVNRLIAERERQRTDGQPLGLLDWMRVLDDVGSHAEVKAVHDALSAPAQRASSGKKKNKQASPSADAASAIADLELSLTRLSLDDASKDVPIRRCVHCQFITHGVKPDPELQRIEAGG